MHRETSETAATVAPHPGSSSCLGIGEESMPDRPFPVDLGNLECAVLPGTPCQNRIVFAGVSAKTSEVEAT